MKKRSLSWKHAAGLSLHLLMDNFFRAVITVVLLGVCCAAFGVCICAYGHDYMGTQAEIFRTYEGNTVALSRFYDVELRPSQQDCVGLDTQDVAELEETFGGRAALSLAGNVLVNVIFRTVLRVPIAVAGFDLVAFLPVIALGLAVGALAAVVPSARLARRSPIQMQPQKRA